MANRRELLEAWSFPHTQRHGVTLVSRSDAAACVRRIIGEGCRFYGYDSFTIFADNTIQPHMGCSPSWSNGTHPPLAEIVAELAAHPTDVTHYEFVFESAA